MPIKNNSIYHENKLRYKYIGIFIVFLGYASNYLCYYDYILMKRFRLFVELYSHDLIKINEHEVMYGTGSRRRLREFFKQSD